MDFADLLKPITAMTKANVVFRWTKDCAAAFDAVKERILKHQKLYFMDYDLPIYVRVDASELGCGAMLYQVKEGLERPAAFGSKTFSATEQKWSVLEQELYAAFWAMRRWERLLLGHPFYLQTDHRNILQLMKAQAPKVVRWRL